MVISTSQTQEELEGSWIDISPRRRKRNSSKTKERRMTRFKKSKIG
jgi:hypothetical protein